MENNAYDPNEDFGQDVTQAEPKPKERSAKSFDTVLIYKILAVVTFVLTIGGLFLGLLGSVDSMGAFVHTISPDADSMGAAVNAKWGFEIPSILSGSLLNYVIQSPLYYVVSIIESFSAGDFLLTLNILLPSLFMLGVSLLFIAAIVASLVCVVVAFVSPERAQSAAIASAVLSFLSYGLLFLWNFSAQLMVYGWDNLSIDLSLGIITGCLFIALAATAILRNKLRGGMMVASVICTLAMVIGIVYPASITSAYVSSSIMGLKTDTLLCILTLFLHMWLCLHVVATLRRTTAKRKYVYDIVRYGVLLGLMLAYFAVGSIIFEQFEISTFFTTTEDIISTVLLLAGCVIGLGVSITARVFYHGDDEEDMDGSEDYEQESYNYSDNDTVYSADPQPRYEEPAYTPTAYEPPVAHAVPVEEPEPQRELTDFEREMLSFAAAPEVAQPAPAPQPAPVYTREPQPAPVFAPRAQQYEPRAQYDRSAYGDGSYTYDPFFTMLTTPEKDEFCDLFIAHKKGEYNDLPIYVIGGDNKEFFNKVWIRYSRYEMSPELKDKIFTYVRTKKK